MSVSPSKHFLPYPASGPRGNSDLQGLIQAQMCFFLKTKTKGFSMISEKTAGYKKAPGLKEYNIKRVIYNWASNWSVIKTHGTTQQ
jgi:hypothetical protein